jgi:hypothetical protein
MLRATGGISPLKNLMASGSFGIPDFQRNYAWGQDQVEAFWNDIEFVAKTNTMSHFIGSVIVLNDPSEHRALVIDGQQRFTTIVMTLSILRDMMVATNVPSLPAETPGGFPVNPLSEVHNLLFNGGEARYEANPILKERFLECVVRDPNDPNRDQFKRTEIAESLPLRKAYWYLMAEVKSHVYKAGGDDPVLQLRSAYRLFRTITDQLAVLKIDCEDQLEAISIYMTMNSRGMDLTPADLLKSLLMKHLTAGLSGQQLRNANKNLVDRWFEIVELVTEVKLNQFLRHYLLINRSMQEAIREKEMFKFFQEIVEGPSIDPAETRMRAGDLFSSLEVNARYYQAILDPDPVTVERSKDRIVINVLNSLMDSHRVFLLAARNVSERLSSSEYFTDCLKETDVLAVRWILAGQNAQVLENLFRSAAIQIMRDSGSVSEAFRMFHDEMPSDTTVSSRMRESSFSISTSRALLWRINEALSHYQGIVNYDPKKLNVEHIAPQTSSAHWNAALNIDALHPSADTEYAELVSRVGNYTLLEYKLNSAIRNGDWKTKLFGSSDPKPKCYEDSVMRLIIDLRNFEQWTDSNIHDRTEWIVRSVLGIWTTGVEQPVLNFV